MVLDIDPTAFVAPGAIVVGDVRLSARCSVWFHAVLRGDSDVIRIDEDTNLQDQCMVHVDEGQPALIGKRVTVGHRAILHGCVVEDDCLIGMGAIVLSGARVGGGSLVAAGALVREGQVIPPGSLVLGAPGRVAGPVAEAHREAIRRGALHYAELARSYRERGIATDFEGAGPKDWLPGGATPIGPLDWDLAVQALASIPAWVRARLAPVVAAESEGTIAEAGVALDLLRDLFTVDERRHRLLSALWEGKGGGAGSGPPTGTRPEADSDSGSIRAALSAWVASRERLVELLAALGPADWARVIEDSEAGRGSLGLRVRAWAEEDLARRAAIAGARTPRP